MSIAVRLQSLDVKRPRPLKDRPFESQKLVIRGFDALQRRRRRRISANGFHDITLPSRKFKDESETSAYLKCVI